MNLTQQRFYGFLNTPLLWNDMLLGIEQFQFHHKDISITQKISDTIRLGNYVEQLVSYQLDQLEDVDILQENIQIIEHKTTLGELDCLIKSKEEVIHLEIAYKFYLYDESVGNSFLEHWIGPNRRDSLVLKINKMKDKQFPLLFHDACQPYLQSLDLQSDQIHQKAFFKAQLFLPYEMNVIDFDLLNHDCVQGFYLNLDQLKNFTSSKFYIPKKLDWLIEPHTDVDWSDYLYAIPKIRTFFSRKSSPLLWMKLPNGELKKVFVTWW